MSDDTPTYFIKCTKELEQEAYKQRRMNPVRRSNRRFSMKYWNKEKEQQQAAAQHLEYPVAHDRFSHHPIRVTDEMNTEHIYPSPDDAAKALGLEYHDIVMICYGKGPNTIYLPWPIHRNVTIREETILSYHELIWEGSEVLDEAESDFEDGYQTVDAASVDGAAKSPECGLKITVEKEEESEGSEDSGTKDFQCKPIVPRYGVEALPKAWSVN